MESYRFEDLVLMNRCISDDRLDFEVVEVKMMMTVSSANSQSPLSFR